jgi:excisionase family DNA binding protein
MDAMSGKTSVMTEETRTALQEAAGYSGSLLDSLPEFSTTEQLARALGISTETINRWRRSGTGGPAYLRFGHGVRFQRTDVLTWLEERRFHPKREELAA